MHWTEKMISPIILGHRGASKYAPENTIAAFDLALKQKADGFELDTMLTADNIPVVIHDHTVDRTTNGTGKVAHLTARQIRELDAGEKFSANYSGEKIPLLEEVFSLYKGKSLINVELKNIPHKSNSLVEIVYSLAKKMGVLDQLIFSSFFSTNLRELNRYHPKAHVALLCIGGWEGFLQRSILYLSLSPNYIHPYYKDCSEKYIKKQLNMNRKINAWTVNKKEDMTELIKSGVTGIITNDPIAAVDLKQDLNNSI
jgi:glycerophosphoryl diester phosphodiesterase